MNVPTIGKQMIVLEVVQGEMRFIVIEQGFLELYYFYE